MPAKDLTQKALLRVPDVFASLINLIFFGGQPFILPSQIHYLDILSHFDYDSSLHPIYRDTCAMILDHADQPFFIVNFENQTRRDPTMAVRALGYTDTIYFWQRNRIIHPRINSSVFALSRFVPAVTIVLHYGIDWWNPRPFFDLIQLERTPFLKPFVSGYTMNLENIAWWSEERIASIRSDFRIIADYCRQVRQNGEEGEARYDPPTRWKIEHVEETLMTLAAFTKDENLANTCWRYVNQFHLNEKKGDVTMKSILDHYYRENFREQEQALLKIKEEIQSSKKEIQFKEKEFQSREKEFQSKEKEFQSREKEIQTKEKEWTEERTEMISSLVRAARQHMMLEGIDAEAACDALCCPEKIRKEILLHLVS